MPLFSLAYFIHWLCTLESCLEQAQDPSCSHVIQIKECVNNYGLERKLPQVRAVLNGERNFFMGAKKLKRKTSKYYMDSFQQGNFLCQTNHAFQGKAVYNNDITKFRQEKYFVSGPGVPDNTLQ